MQSNKDTAYPAAGIAVIGLSGKYPQAANIEQFWYNLEHGRDCITEIPASRFDYREYYRPPADQYEEGTMYSKAGGFIDEFDLFDPGLFGIKEDEALTMPPEERLILHMADNAVRDAGYSIRQLLASCKGDKKHKDADVGVFIGVTASSISYQQISRDLNTGTAFPVNANAWSLANRVSHVFNFHGPSLPIDTACSSSLVAIHYACQSLLHGECCYAIAGGVSLFLHPSLFIARCRSGMMSKRGRCSVFSEHADGYVVGEGVGVVLLKPLARALRDGDTIHGVIKGSAVNHGGWSSGYYVPNPFSQAEVIARAIVNAEIDAQTLTYLETHGTGTPVGDPVEIKSLQKAFNRFNVARQSCAIGSVKSNIGHTEAAAGIAALTKVILQLKHKKLVPSLHAQPPNPMIDFKKTPFFVQQHCCRWKAHGEKRRAGINSFGAGGVNAHLILEEGDYTPKTKRTPLAAVALNAKRYWIPDFSSSESLPAGNDAYRSLLEEELKKSAYQVFGNANDFHFTGNRITEKFSRRQRQEFIELINKEFRINTTPYLLIHTTSLAQIADHLLENYSSSLYDYYQQQRKIFKTAPLLIFDFNNDFLNELSAYPAGHILVLPGHKYKKINDLLYELNPRHPDEYRLLLESLSGNSRLPEYTCHFWSYFNTRDANLKAQYAEESLKRLTLVLQRLPAERERQLLYFYPNNHHSTAPTIKSSSAIAGGIRVKSIATNTGSSIHITPPITQFVSLVSKEIESPADASYRIEDQAAVRSHQPEASKGWDTNQITPKAIEHYICDYLAEKLQVNPAELGPQSELLDCGCDSLLLLDLTDLLGKRFNCKISLADFFEHKTIAALAVHILNNKNNSSGEQQHEHQA